MNTSKKTRKRRKLFISLLMILFTGTILTTSTYAWFTANKTVSLSNIDINVAGANGLQVSVDGLNWKTLISNTDITGAATTYPKAVNQLPGVPESLVPISTVGDIDTTTGFMKMYKGEISSNTSGNFILSATENKEVHGTSGAFIAFDLFFQLKDATNVYLTSNSSIIAKNTSTGIENAGRVALVNEGNVAAGSDIAVIQGLKATAPTNNVFIWEPNYDVHTASGVAYAKSTYGLTTTLTGGTALTYYGVKAPILADKNIPLNSNDNLYFGQVSPSLTTPVAGILPTDYKLTFNLKAGINKVRVYMWVEGQDVDCENNASGGSVTYNLQFSTNTKA